jgi:hypothetical protein
MMSDIPSAIRDLARTIFSRGPLAWGQILFLWLAGAVIIGPMLYLAHWLGNHRLGWVRVHWVAGQNGVYVLSPYAADQAKATLGLVAEIALVACAAGVLLFLLGRSFEAHDIKNLTPIPGCFVDDLFHAF